MMPTTPTRSRHGLAGAVTATVVLTLTGCAESLRESPPIHRTEALQTGTVQQVCRTTVDEMEVLRVTGLLVNTAQDPIQLGAARLAHPADDLTLLDATTVAGVTLHPGDRLDVVAGLGRHSATAGTSSTAVDVLVPYRQGDALFTVLTPGPQPWPTTPRR